MAGVRRLPGAESDGWGESATTGSVLSTNCLFLMLVPFKNTSKGFITQWHVGRQSQWKSCRWAKKIKLFVLEKVKKPGVKTMAWRAAVVWYLENSWPQPGTFKFYFHHSYWTFWKYFALSSPHNVFTLGHLPTLTPEWTWLKRSGEKQAFIPKRMIANGCKMFVFLGCCCTLNKHKFRNGVWVHKLSVFWFRFVLRAVLMQSDARRGFCQ